MKPKQFDPNTAQWGDAFAVEGGSIHYFIGKLPLKREGVQLYAFQRRKSTYLTALSGTYGFEGPLLACPEQNIRKNEQPVSSKTKGSKTMDKNIAALLRKDATTIGVKFTKDGPYAYVTHLPVKVGDMVVVESQGRPRVGEVTEVHDELQIAPDAELTYNWVIDIVDMAAHKANVAKNALLEETMADIYLANRRAAFTNALLSMAAPEKLAEIESIIQAKPLIGG